MAPKIRVTILDHHQGIVDGYLYRLSNFPQIEVAASLAFGEELASSLAEHATDVLLSDIHVPTTRNDPNPYPILQAIPNLLQNYPTLNILVISMYAERSLIQAVMQAGASGYILKDDQASIRNLGNILLSVADGGIYFSQQAQRLFLRHQRSQSAEDLTPRQRQVLSLCATHPEWSTDKLAQNMIVTNSTLHNLLSSAYLRLGVRTRLAAIHKARQLGLITPTSPITPL